MHSLKARAVEDLRKNGYAYLIMLFLLLCGIAAGVSYCNKLSAPARESLGRHIALSVELVRQGGLNYAGCFLNLTLPAAIMMLMLLASSLHVFALPLLLVALIAKGFYSGFFLASVFGAGDFLLSAVLFLSTLLPKLALTLVFIKFGGVAVGNAFALFKRRRLITSFAVRARMSSDCFNACLRLFIVACACTLFEAVVSMWFIGL